MLHPVLKKQCFVCSPTLSLGLPVCCNSSDPRQLLSTPQSQLFIGQPSFSLKYRSQPLNPASEMGASLFVLCLNVCLCEITSKVCFYCFCWLLCQESGFYLCMKCKTFLGCSVLIRNNREVIRSFVVILVCVSQKRHSHRKRRCSLKTLFTPGPPLKLSSNQALFIGNKNTSMCCSPLTGTMTLLRQYLFSGLSEHINTFSLSFNACCCESRKCFFCLNRQMQI